VISIYKLFRIIFGIIASVFILYFLIYYSAVYSEMQRDTQRVLILKAFKKTAQDVYLTGIPINFSQFSKLEFDLYFEGTAEPPKLRSSVSSMIVMTPLFFAQGDNIFIERLDLDYGWWKFDFVEAVPDMTIIFNPLENTEEIWDMMKNITKTLPDTTNFRPKVTFGFCDGINLDENLCGGKPCERYDFLNILNQQHGGVGFSKCTAGMDKEKYRLVTVSSSCRHGFADKGICIVPSQTDIGNFYINGSAETYIYKDPLDLVSAIIGGDSVSIYGIGAEELFKYKNKILGNRMKIMSKVMAQRSVLISGRLQANTNWTECVIPYKNLADTLYFGGQDSISNILSNENYYKNLPLLMQLKNKLNEARAQYQELVDKGCEYIYV